MQIRSFTPCANLSLNAANRNQRLSFGENKPVEKESPTPPVKIYDSNQNGSWPDDVTTPSNSSTSYCSQKGAPICPQDVDWGWGDNS